MDTRDVMRRTRRIGAKKKKIYMCAESSFSTVADTLELEGREYVLKAISSISGGIANYGTGCCGAIAGASAAIALSFGAIPDRTEAGLKLRARIFDAISEVVQKFQDRYGGLSCREVQIKLFGKAFDLRDSASMEEYRKLDMEDVQIIEDVSVWAVDAILKAQPELLLGLRADYPG
jgi:C_GCAxxG_C_C family probable redox protein